MSRKVFTPEQETQVVAEYADGRSLRQIGAAYGAGTRAVTRVLEQHGVKRRPAVRPRGMAEKSTRSRGRGAGTFSEEERADVLARFVRGETQAAIGEHYGCAAATIARVLRAAGADAGAHGQLRERHHNWKGGRMFRPSDGYVMVRPEPGDELGQAMKGANGYVLEHRLVMAHALGRPLAAEETVHHGAGGKADNRLENLELWASRHPRGQRVADLVAFAREVLDLYGDVPPTVVG